MKSLKSFELFSEKILQGIQVLKITPLASFQIEKLYHFYQLLVKWNKKINLTAHQEGCESIEKNFLDCLFLSFLFSTEKNVLDVGSGAGFPGLILKIIHTDLKIFLLESNQKKSSFLEYVIQELSLKNINVLSKRFEETIINSNFIHDIDTIVSRATIPITNFFKILKSHLKLETKIILMIGKSDFDKQNFENFILEKKFFYQLPFSKLERGVFIFRHI